MPAPEFTMNTHRYDPYKTFKFRVKWDGQYVAGISKVGGLTRTTQLVSRPAVDDPVSSHKASGQTDYAPITLERGVTYDPNFVQWAEKVWMYSNTAGQEVAIKDFRKEIIIELYNEAGQKAVAYAVYRCWVSEFTAMPELDGGNAVAIQSITLQHEGWEREDPEAAPAEGTPPT